MSLSRILQVLLVFCASTVVAQTATVKTEQLAVLPGLTKSAAPVATLNRGDSVNVELTISSVEGEWCYIRAEKSSASGYVPCVSLDRPEPPAASPLRTPSTSPSTRSSSTALTDISLEKLDCEVLNYRAWMARYNFTYEQTRQAQQVAGEIGLSECSRKAAPFQQRYASDRSAANKMRLLRQWAKVDPRDSCALAAKKFWPKVRPTMTEEQLAKMHEDLVVLRKNVMLIQFMPEKCIPIFCIY